MKHKTELPPGRQALANHLGRLKALHAAAAEAKAPLERLEQAREELKAAEQALAEIEHNDAEAMQRWAETGEGSPPVPTDRTAAERRLANAKASAKAAESAYAALSEKQMACHHTIGELAKQTPLLQAEAVLEEALSMVPEWREAGTKLRALNLCLEAAVTTLSTMGEGNLAYQIRAALNDNSDAIDHVETQRLMLAAWRAFAEALRNDPEQAAFEAPEAAAWGWTPTQRRANG